MTYIFLCAALAAALIVIGHQRKIIAAQRKLITEQLDWAEPLCLLWEDDWV